MNEIFDKLPKSGHKYINLWVVPHPNPAYPALTTLGDSFFLQCKYILGVLSMIRVLASCTYQNDFVKKKIVQTKE